MQANAVPRPRSTPQRHCYPHFSTEQGIAATAAQELAREKPIAITAEAPNGAEAAEADNGRSDSTGLDADSFVRVCLQLMRDNFLAKVQAL